MERTLCIIKPDVTGPNKLADVLNEFLRRGLKIAAMEMTHISKGKFSEFYAEHKDKNFFADLISFMCSGSVVLVVLEGENIIKDYREMLGATDPKEAATGTLRERFGEGVPNNAFHGSDSPESAEREIKFFFPDL